MRILFLTFYYEPDLSAGSFRSTALIDSLLGKIGRNDHIDVLTTLPNRYASYSEKVNQVDNYEKLSIIRFRIKHHKSGMIDQALSFLSYLRQVKKYVRKKEYNIVYATSSRLFTAYLGATISREKKTPLFLDIRDIFVDTLNSVIQNKLLRSVFSFIKIIEKKTINRATKINLVSEGFREYFLNLRSDIEYIYIPNGIDEEFVNYDFQKRKISEKETITYAGNIGQGQGLEKIVPELSLVLGDKFIINIIGDGGMRRTLEKRLKEQSIKNVQIKKPVKRTELLSEYRNSDYLFLHLNNYKAFEKVLPSKIFEYAATGKPVIAGVSGYAEKFIKTNLESNWLVFSPADISDFIMKFEMFNGHYKVNNEFVSNYKRSVLMDQLANEILSCLTDNT